MCESLGSSVRLDTLNVVRSYAPTSLAIDYAATLVEVFASVVESIHCVTQKLDIIYIYFPLDSYSWPSWVPAWYRKFPVRESEDWGLLTEDMPEGYANTHDHLYAASGDSIAIASFDSGSKT